MEKGFGNKCGAGQFFCSEMINGCELEGGDGVCQNVILNKGGQLAGIIVNLNGA